MDWRSSSSSCPSTRSVTSDRQPRARLRRIALCALALATLALVAAGCGRHAVRASEKEFLADPVMIFDYDGQEAMADDHVLTNREGSAGGRGTSGGGCGCN